MGAVTVMRREQGVGARTRLAVRIHFKILHEIYGHSKNNGNLGKLNLLELFLSIHCARLERYWTRANLYEHFKIDDL